MSIPTRNPRRARLVATLAGLAVAILGGVLWLVGDNNEVTGSNRMDINSSAAWNDVVGYRSDQTDEFESGRDLRDTGESQMTWGIVLAVVGLAAVGSRWLISPAPTPAKPAPAKLTPEQQEQAIAMYLEAQRRSATEQ
ncbi:hypothetical protein ACFYWN_44810 [Streptomyces sp. NPDC002917]|uniref:hypothetical protein n=1 Tax=Streptomyces sp. NPDC002917 TaxID=3364671 RepID=UPI00369F08DC